MVEQRKIRKKIWLYGEWHDMTFILLPQTKELEDWCNQYYRTKREYLGAWFKTHSHIVMDEKTYVHWKLCE